MVDNLWLLIHRGFVLVPLSRWGLAFATHALLMGIFVNALLLMHLYLVAVNLTTNESINQMRYFYLRDSSGRYANPFNKGILMVCFVEYCAYLIVLDCVVYLQNLAECLRIRLEPIQATRPHTPVSASPVHDHQHHDHDGHDHSHGHTHTHTHTHSHSHSSALAPTDANGNGRGDGSASYDSDHDHHHDHEHGSARPASSAFRSLAGLMSPGLKDQ